MSDHVQLEHIQIHRGLYRLALSLPRISLRTRPIDFYRQIFLIAFDFSSTVCVPNKKGQVPESAYINPFLDLALRILICVCRDGKSLACVNAMRVRGSNDYLAAVVVLERPQPD
jgi:hypothetical protein